MDQELKDLEKPLVDLSKVPGELNFDLVHLGHTGKVKVVKADDPKRLTPGTTVSFFIYTHKYHMFVSCSQSM